MVPAAIITGPTRPSEATIASPTSPDRSNSS